MKPILIADAGPLIALGKLAQLSLLRHLYARVLLPQAVVEECLPDPRLPGAVAVEAALASGLLIQVDDPAGIDDFALPLGRGERATLILAQGLGADVLVDDLRARSVARGLGVPVVGTLGVLVAARENGLIAALAPLLEQARASGYYLSNALVEAALRRVGESR